MSTAFASKSQILKNNSAGQRLWLRLLPAAALGSLVWLVPAESQAAPTCTTKPAICNRLAATQKQRAESLVVKAQPAPAVAPSAVVAQNVTPAATCTTKPSVCARLEARGLRPATPPVTLASNAEADGRCTTKPAVCARLRVRPAAAPVTLATAAGDVR